MIPCKIFWLRLPEKNHFCIIIPVWPHFYFEIVMRLPTFAESSDHFCINITYTYLIGLPAIDYRRGENGDAYMAYLYTVIGKSSVRVKVS